MSINIVLVSLQMRGRGSAIVHLPELGNHHNASANGDFIAGEWPNELGVWLNGSSWFVTT